MSHITRGLLQDVTYWGSPVSDGRGGFTFADPVLCKGRWEDKQEVFVDSKREEKVSSAVIYLDQDVEVDGYIALGDFTNDSAYEDPVDVDTAYKIRAFGKIPNLKATEFERTAWV